MSLVSSTETETCVKEVRENRAGSKETKNHGSGIILLNFCMLFTIDVKKFYSNFQGVVLQACDSLGPQSWQQSFIERLVGGELHGEVS